MMTTGQRAQTNDGQIVTVLGFSNVWKPADQLFKDFEEDSEEDYERRNEVLKLDNVKTDFDDDHK